MIAVLLSTDGGASDQAQVAKSSSWTEADIHLTTLESEVFRLFFHPLRPFSHSSASTYAEFPTIRTCYSTLVKYSGDLHLGYVLLNSSVVPRVEADDCLFRFSTA